MKIQIKNIEPKKRDKPRCEWCNVMMIRDNERYLHIITEMNYFDVCEDCFKKFVKKSSKMTLDG